MFAQPVKNLVFCPPPSSYDERTPFEQMDAVPFYAGSVPCVAFPHAEGSKVVLVAHANAEDIWSCHHDYDRMRLTLKVVL